MSYLTTAHRKISKSEELLPVVKTASDRPKSSSVNEAFLEVGFLQIDDKRSTKSPTSSPNTSPRRRRKISISPNFQRKLEKRFEKLRLPIFGSSSKSDHTNKGYNKRKVSEPVLNVAEMQIDRRLKYNSIDNLRRCHSTDNLTEIANQNSTIQEGDESQDFDRVKTTHDTYKENTSNSTPAVPDRMFLEVSSESRSYSIPNKPVVHNAKLSPVLDTEPPSLLELARVFRGPSVSSNSSSDTIVPSHVPEERSRQQNVSEYDNERSTALRPKSSSDSGVGSVSSNYKYPLHSKISNDSVTSNTSTPSIKLFPTSSFDSELGSAFSGPSDIETDIYEEESETDVLELSSISLDFIDHPTEGSSSPRMKIPDRCPNILRPRNAPKEEYTKADAEQRRRMIRDIGRPLVDPSQTPSKTSQPPSRSGSIKKQSPTRSGSIYKFPARAGSINRTATSSKAKVKRHASFDKQKKRKTRDSRRRRHVTKGQHLQVEIPIDENQKRGKKSPKGRLSPQLDHLTSNIRSGSYVASRKASLLDDERFQLENVRKFSYTPPSQSTQVAVGRRKSNSVGDIYGVNAVMSAGLNVPLNSGRKVSRPNMLLKWMKKSHSLDDAIDP